MDNNITFSYNQPRKMENWGIEKSDHITWKYILPTSVCYLEYGNYQNYWLYVYLTAQHVLITYTSILHMTQAGFLSETLSSWLACTVVYYCSIVCKILPEGQKCIFSVYYPAHLYYFWQIIYFGFCQKLSNFLAILMDVIFGYPLIGQFDTI